jgi:type I restriction enzyme R subunit
MLASVVKRYHNNQIDTAQVIKELSEMAREMKLEDNKAETLGLTPQEYAFYSILSQNSSTKHLEDHKMKELIHLIVDIIRKMQRLIGTSEPMLKLNYACWLKKY